MKHFLFIQDHLHGGGAEQICIDTAVGLKSLGHQVTVLLLDGTQIRTQYPDDLSIIKFNIAPKFLKGSIKKNKLKAVSIDQQQQLLEIIASLKPDTIFAGHSHAFWLSPILSGNVWYWVHGDTLGLVIKKKIGFFKFLEGIKKFIACRRACNFLFQEKQVIAVNNDIADLLNRHVKNINVKVIHNGIHIDRLIQNIDLNAPIKKKWDAIFVGRLSEEKQPDVALRAFAETNLAGRMAIVGDGPMLNKLHQLVIDLKLENQVDFLGWQNQPSQFIRQSRCLILSSRTEGCPLIVSESLIIGTPVVAYNCCEGVEFQLSSGELKKGLVPLNQLEILTQQLKTIILDPYSITDQDKQRLGMDVMVKQFELL
ncbi:glycosyltransferase [Acinetobacter sp. AHP123]|uniref:glycosyltransferase n=1 Tax=Acinetobacter sp. AHP123 TaxID=2913495 RepID=UPI002074DB6E|nr:glycosyltransferase [Acinetobacter sp. AHP123]